MGAIIHVVDDDDSFRRSLGRMLETCGYQVALYASGQQFLAEMPDRAPPGCIVLDMRLPGLSGPELQQRLLERHSTLPIVFLTGHGDIPASVLAIKAGAEDFLTKPVPKDRLLDAVERALAKGRAAREESERLNVLRAAVGTLTAREREVFQLVVLGRLNKEIARELGTTERTIKAHRQKVMEKTRAETLAELVSLAQRLGIATASK